MHPRLDLNRIMPYGRDLLAQQNFSRLLGAKLESIKAGYAEIQLVVTQQLLQQHGFVHSGVLAYLVDNAMAFSAGSVLGDAVTLEFKINYIRSTKGASVLKAQAHVESHGKRTAVVRCEVFAEINSCWVQVALAQGTNQVPGKNSSSVCEA